MKKHFATLIFFMFFGLFQTNYASEILSASTEVPIVKREFGENLNEKYTGSQFDYTEDIGENQNLIQNFLKWFFQKIGNSFNIEISNETVIFFEILFYGLFIAFTCYLIFRVLSTHPSFSIIKKETNSIENQEYSIEDIADTDYNRLISEALKSDDYRLAIRYSYLKSLQVLSKKNFINLNSKKTNSDYTKEIQNSDIKYCFKKISYWYDHSWYGAYDLNTHDFEKANTDFKQLENKVNYG